MKNLDRWEQGYYHVDVKCELYPGKATSIGDTTVTATAYQFDEKRLHHNGPMPPPERYKNLILRGMRHFGCDPAAIEEVEAISTEGARDWKK